MFGGLKGFERKGMKLLNGERVSGWRKGWMDEKKGGLM